MKNKGAIAVEVAILSFVLLGIAIFFFGLNSRMICRLKLDTLIQKSLVELRTNITLFPVKELSNSADSFLSKNNLPSIPKSIKNMLKQEGIKLYISNLVKNKVEGDFLKTFHLKEDLTYKFSAKKDTLMLEVDAKFSYPSLLPFFDSKDTVLYFEVALKDADKFLNSEDFFADKENDENKIYITKNGIKNTKVFHTSKDCFGMNFAKHIIELECKDKNNIEVFCYNGQNYTKCPFSK